MSEDVWAFLHEARVLICDPQYEEVKGIVSKAVQLTSKIFAHFKLKGLAPNRNVKSYADYRTLEAIVKAVSRPSSRLLPSLENEALVIPEHLTCIGPFWMEDWRDRKTEERFSFEGWRADIQENSSHLLGLLRQIYRADKFPPKLKRPAKELHKLVIRELEESIIEYSTFQDLKTKNLVISLPLDYPHFWSEHSDEDITFKKVLEDPEVWRNALGRSLTPQGSVIPVIPQYEEFPWVAVTGRRVFAQLETTFDDRYFMASSELNLLNTILLEDEAETNF